MTKARYSLPFFVSADWDKELSCLPSCVSESRPAKYEPFNVGEYIMGRIKSFY